MSFSFGAICILLLSTAAELNPPSPAQAPPPQTFQTEETESNDSGDRTILKLQVGKPVDITLLNRTKDLSQHKTYFLPDPTHRCGVMVFDDDAVGTTIGVVATDLRWESDDFEAGWLQERRFWQDKTWCLDVTSIAWSEDGRYLFVATCDIYGSGNVYQLNLKKRRAAVIFPREADTSVGGHCLSTQIDAIGKDSVTISARDYCEGDKVLAQVELPFMTEASFDSASGKEQPAETKVEGKSACESSDK